MPKIGHQKFMEHMCVERQEWGGTQALAKQRRKWKNHHNFPISGGSSNLLGISSGELQKKGTYRSFICSPDQFVFGSERFQVPVVIPSGNLT